MSDETRAVMREIIRGVQEVSSDFWEFVPDGENAIKMGKKGNFPVQVIATQNKVQIWTEIHVLQGHFQEASIIEDDSEYFVVDLGNGAELGFELGNGHWYHHFNWQVYPGRKTEVHKLMLLAQCSCLLNASWFNRVTRQAA